MKNNKDIKIMLVEDDLVDMKIISGLLENVYGSETIINVRDGEETWELLSKTYETTQLKQLPNVIMLDINMPKMGGFELLSKIRSKDSLNSLIAVIFTSLEDKHTILEAYQLHAAGYIIKPNTYDELKSTITALTNYWKMITHRHPQSLAT